jgi:hypothetical protein
MCCQLYLVEDEFFVLYKWMFVAVLFLLIQGNFFNLIFYMSCVHRPKKKMKLVVKNLKSVFETFFF